MTFSCRNDGSGRRMDGNLIPKKVNDPKNWRKAFFARPLDPGEFALIGDGGGSEDLGHLIDDID